MYKRQMPDVIVNPTTLTANNIIIANYTNTNGQLQINFVNTGGVPVITLSLIHIYCQPVNRLPFLMKPLNILQPAALNLPKAMIKAKRLFL